MDADQLGRMVDDIIDVICASLSVIESKCLIFFFFSYATKIMALLRACNSLFSMPYDLQTLGCTAIGTMARIDCTCFPFMPNN